MASIEAVVPITKSTPKDMFNKLALKTFLAPLALPQRISSIEVLKGDGVHEGSIMKWTYVLLEGIEESSKERIDEVNKKQMLIKSSFLELDIASKYNMFSVEWLVGVINERRPNDVVKCRINYDKKKDVPETDPYQHLELFCEMIVALDNFPLLEEKQALL